ncbi:hypothetical protein [Lacticaseibacillus paracasei]|uniref:hypothetical protein n=1 Tax=Lacticaseibacillus paracasei TaxID=1597 RepID=UPI0012D41986|nr:hypothetical protein [Lacticaseibacillus paracasei]
MTQVTARLYKQGGAAMKRMINNIWNMSPSALNMNLIIICGVLAAMLLAFLHWVNKQK